jgi:hypothetical protein
MKHWLWIIMLLPASLLFAKDKKLGGYVLDPAAFRKIQTYCVDTHNLPPREVKVINQFLAHESKPSGPLARLPWQRLATCREGYPDAIVRPEFSPDHFGSIFMRRAIDGVLLVFRAGSPTPIYETRPVLMTHIFDGDSNGFDTAALEHDALYFVVRILIHDLRKLSESPPATAS